MVSVPRNDCTDLLLSDSVWTFTRAPLTIIVLHVQAKELGTEDIFIHSIDDSLLAAFLCREFSKSKLSGY